jgi:hypothetical protein
LREIRLLLSCDSDPASLSESEAVVGFKERKTPAKKSSGIVTKRALLLKEQQKRRSSTRAAWVRMSVAICVKDGSRDCHNKSNQDDDSCTAIQDEGTQSLTLDSQPQIDAEQRESPLINNSNQTAALNPFESPGGELEHRNQLCSENISPVTCRCDLDSDIEGTAYAHKNIPDIQIATELPAAEPRECANQMVFKQRESRNTVMLSGERDDTLLQYSHLIQPDVKRAGSMKIGMISGKSDITLVSSQVQK